MDSRRRSGTRDAAQLRSELARRFEHAPPELAFEAVVEGRDAIVAVDGPARQMQVISAAGDDQVIDLRAGGTIVRLHRGSSIEAHVESGGHRVTLYDLTDWATSGLLIEALRLRGFRSESPTSGPTRTGRPPRVLATQRRGIVQRPSTGARASA